MLALVNNKAGIMQTQAFSTYSNDHQVMSISKSLFFSDGMTPGPVLSGERETNRANHQERFGLLFYKESDGTPLQAVFAELAINNSQTLYEHIAKLNPACHTGTMLYLSRVKLPATSSKMVFDNEFISTNSYGGNIWVQDTMAVVAVKLMFEQQRMADTFQGDFFEHPIIYKGKTTLTHARLKPTDWGNLSAIAPINLTSTERYDDRYWMTLLAS
jgi:hypothetical protein